MNAPYFAGLPNWRPVTGHPAAPSAVAATPANPPEPHPACASTPAHATRKLTKLEILWSSRLTAAFAARTLPPAPESAQQSGRGKVNENDPYRDIQYRNPAGQLVVRPGISTENRPMSDLEWSTHNILRRKYPDIYRELLAGALEYAGYIEPGADPDFPDSVVGILPPNERFRNGPLVDPLKPPRILRDIQIPLDPQPQAA